MGGVFAQATTLGASATRPLGLQVPCRRSGRGAPCTFRHLKQSTRYCVRTVAVGTAPERSREAEQCLVTPAAPAGESSPRPPHGSHSLG